MSENCVVLNVGDWVYHWSYGIKELCEIIDVRSDGIMIKCHNGTAHYIFATELGAITMGYRLDAKKGAITYYEIKFDENDAYKEKKRLEMGGWKVAIKRAQVA